MIEIFGILAGILVFVAFILNRYKHEACWLAWIGSAILFTIYGAFLGAISLMVQNIIFIPIFIWGWRGWRKDPKRSKK